MSALEELRRRVSEATGTECVDWPSGARLEALPVGARVLYPRAQYERTESGMCCFRASGIGANTMVGRYFALDGGWSDPESVCLPPGYRFSGSEVVKDEPAVASCSLTDVLGEAYTQLCDESCGKVHLGIESPLVIGQRLQLEALEKLAANPNAISRQFSPGYAQAKKPTCSCGATRNIHVSLSATVPLYECGPCAQVRRRAELQAAKLDQTKRDMDRPVKRDPYEWPAGFSSPSWEE
jgi:hypothetical protein